MKTFHHLYTLHCLWRSQGISWLNILYSHTLLTFGEKAFSLIELWSPWSCSSWLYMFCILLKIFLPTWLLRGILLVLESLCHWHHRGRPVLACEGPCSVGRVQGELVLIGCYCYNIKIHTNLTNKGLNSKSKCQLNNALRNTKLTFRLASSLHLEKSGCY